MATSQGVPQGGPLSPLLANIVLAGLIRYTEGRLQLIVNRAKSRAALLKQ